MKVEWVIEGPFGLMWDACNELGLPCTGIDPMDEDETHATEAECVMSSPVSKAQAEKFMELAGRMAGCGLISVRIKKPTPKGSFPPSNMAWGTATLPTASWDELSINDAAVAGSLRKRITHAVAILEDLK